MKCKVWKYLEMLDVYEKKMAEAKFEVGNSMRAAVLMTVLADEMTEGARAAMLTMTAALKIPKAVYFEAVLLIESRARLSASPSRGKSRFIYNRDFLDALDYNRIVCRAEGKDENTLNEWADLYEKKGKER